MEKFFREEAHKFDILDGLSVSSEMWRFNLREPDTEKLVRLNVEVSGDKAPFESKKKVK